MGKEEIQDLLDELEEKKSGTTKTKKKASEKPIVTGVIPVKQVKVNKENRELDKSAVDEIAKSIEKYGLIIPIVIDSEKNLLDGERRLRAFEKLGKKEIPFIVVNKNFDSTTLVTNFIRENLTKGEVKTILNRMKDEDNKSQTEIAEEIGLSKSRVSQLIGKRIKKPKEKKKKKVQSVELPENIKMAVKKSSVSVTFTLNEMMLKKPLESISKLFAEIKDFKGIIERARI